MRAAAGDNADADGILTAMRKTGDVTDSVKPPQAAAGGGSGKKPPTGHGRAASATPDPDDGESARRDMCRETLERGGLLSRDEYERDIAAGSSESFEEWEARQIAEEVARRDPEWVSAGKKAPVVYQSEIAREELKDYERHSADVLSNNGFAVTIIERRRGDRERTADSRINGDLVDFKSPKGSKYSTIDGLLRKAATQGNVAVIDLSARSCPIDDETAISHIKKSLKERGLDYVLLITHDDEIIRIKRA